MSSFISWNCGNSEISFILSSKPEECSDDVFIVDEKNYLKVVQKAMYDI